MDEVDACRNSAAGVAVGFLIEAILRVPVVLRYPIPLEAILARRMVDVGDSFDLNRIPLVRLADRVWCASQSFLVAPVQRVAVPFIRATKPGIFFERHHLGLAASRVGKVETKRRDTRNVLDEREAAVCRSIVWWGRGDIAEVSRLASGLREVGAKRAQGYGEVEEVRITPFDSVPDDFGACRIDGSPTRPLPAAWWDGRGRRGRAVEAVLTIGLPRWSAEPEEVVVPEDDFIWPSDLAELFAGKL